MNIEIYIDGVWATSGTLKNGEIECPGVLGDSAEETEEIYEAIEEDVESSEWTDGSIIINDKKYEWEVSDDD